MNETVLQYQANKIDVLNGTLDLLTLTLENQSKYQTVAIPVTYDPMADCPMFKEFLKEVIPDERDRLAMEEFFGYCLYPYNLFPVITILFGDGNNGKSTLLHVLKTFLYEENCSCYSPQQLENNRWSLAGLRGKLVNISTDTLPLTMNHTVLIKQLTGNNMILADRKSSGPITFRNFAKLIYSTNVLPEITDSSGAVARRVRVITFPNHFESNKERREQLISQMTTPEELSGILNLAVAGLKRLLSETTSLLR